MKCHLFVLFLSLASAADIVEDDKEASLTALNSSGELDAENDSVETPGLIMNRFSNIDKSIENTKKCERGSYLERHEKASYIIELQNCFRNLVDFKVLSSEFKKAGPTQNISTVTKKYCEKSSLLKECFSDFVHATELCVDEKKRAILKLDLRYTENFINFICFEEGTRITSFITEGGLECLFNKRLTIPKCFDTFLTKHDPEFLVEFEECDDMVGMENCMINEFELCENPILDNMIESLFKFIKRANNKCWGK